MPVKNKSVSKKEADDKKVAQDVAVTQDESNNQVNVDALIKSFNNIVNLDINTLYRENNTQKEYEQDLDDKNKLFLEVSQLTIRINHIRFELVELIVKIQQEYKAKYQLNNSVNVNDDTDDTKEKDVLQNDVNDDDIDDVPIVDVKKSKKNKVEPGETVVEEVRPTNKKIKTPVKSTEVTIEESEQEKTQPTEKSTAVVEEVQETKPKKKVTKKAVEQAPVTETVSVETKKKKK
jgi:hypothetical protein